MNPAPERSERARNAHQSIHLVLSTPATIDTRKFIAGLQSYLDRWGAQITTWGPEEEQ